MGETEKRVFMPSPEFLKKNPKYQLPMNEQLGALEHMFPECTVDVSLPVVSLFINNDKVAMKALSFSTCH